MRCHSQSFLLVRDPTSVPISRHRLQDLVKKWGLRLDESSDIALTVITSELVTNAVRHGTGTMLTITVSANLSRRRILVEVYDGSLVLPVPHWADSEDESGRGMALIDRLSLCHGAEHTTCGKCVWAEIAMPPQRVTRQRLILRPRRAARAIARRLGTVCQPRTAVRVDSRAGHGRHARAVPRRLSAPQTVHEQRPQVRDQEEVER
ncbi:ATP-binding protein [Streptomyces caniferus]|uniref:ATP-binding protein n=1 Tax=Streptomyces caniferus TaxID=285557 RepID=UPI002E2D7714|nr:ATP-binding protein [Streptomyces caniferus]